jgi:hypothetical protein
MQYQELGSAYFEQHQQTVDGELALRAITEGEAVLYADLAYLFGFGREFDDVDWDAAFHASRVWGWDGIRQSQAPFALSSTYFPYGFGGRYMNEAYRKARNRAVRAVVAEPPDSTRQIMAGYAAVRDGGRPFREDPNDVGQPQLAPVYQQLGTLHLGAWLFEVFSDIWSARKRGLDEYVDSGFAGDVLSIFRGPAENQVTSIWRLRFDRADQAPAFVSHLLDRQWLKAFVADRDVIVIASEDESVPGTLMNGLEWTQAPAAGAQPSAASATNGSMDDAVCGPHSGALPAR